MTRLQPTPFRKRYEAAHALTAEAQLREVTDYLQNPEVLVTEFFESYYLVEELEPEAGRGLLEDSASELVLETFFDSLQLYISDADGKLERLLCAGGAFDPLPGRAHPALDRTGLDYVALRGGSSRLVLGVATSPDEKSPYSLLLRALVCFSEIASPFQLARLRERVIRNRVAVDGTFDLQIALSKTDPAASPAENALSELTRDLAEVFRRRLDDHDQFSGTLGAIECLRLNLEVTELPEALQLVWRV